VSLQEDFVCVCQFDVDPNVRRNSKSEYTNRGTMEAIL
jgi:hypothetical protein